ncbi:hypothetical protein ACWGID_05490 [Kribbella sp. NPDC054772]
MSLFTIEHPEFRLRLLLEEDEAPETVSNVDGWIDIPGRGSWAGTFLTVAEVARLMERWRETGENASGAYFVALDGIIVRDPGVESILTAAQDLVATGDYELYLIKSENIEL